MVTEVIRDWKQNLYFKNVYYYYNFILWKSYLKLILLTNFIKLIYLIN